MTTIDEAQVEAFTEVAQGDPDGMMAMPSSLFGDRLGSFRVGFGVRPHPGDHRA